MNKISKSIILGVLRIFLVLFVIILISQKDFLFAFSALIAFLISLLPVFIRRNYQVDFPWIIEFLIVLGLFMHITGEYYDLFSKYYILSPIMHFLGTFIIALLALIIVYTLNLTKYVRLSMFMIGLFTAVFALAIGGLWEIGEFTSDNILGTHSQGDGIDPLTDTMLDMIMDCITGIVVGIIGAGMLDKRHYLIHPFEEAIKRFKKRKK